MEMEGVKCEICKFEYEMEIEFSFQFTCSEFYQIEPEGDFVIGLGIVLGVVLYFFAHVL